MLKIGVASFWHVHAMDYAKDLKASARAALALVWDEDIERGAAAASELKVPFEPDYDRFLDAVDALVMTAPTKRHGGLLIRATAAGKHVFSEKVLAVSGREAADIIRAFRRSGVVLSLSLPRLFNPEIRMIKQLINEGALGQVTSVRTRASHDGGVVGWLPERFFNLDETGGGAFIDLGAHPVYVANWLMGQPLQVTAQFYRVQPQCPVDDNSAVIITYEGNRFAVAEAAFVNGRHPFLSVEVYGTGGTLYFGTPEPRIWINSSQRGSDGYVEVPASGHDVPSALEHWLDQILDRVPQWVSDDEIVRLSQVMEAAAKSAKNRQQTTILPI